MRVGAVWLGSALLSFELLTKAVHGLCNGHTLHYNSGAFTHACSSLYAEGL